MILIYFDNKNLEDYLSNPTYNKAYNLIINYLKKDKIPCFIWDGNIDKNGLIKTMVRDFDNDQHQEKMSHFKEVTVVFVRGIGFNHNKYLRFNKDFVYFNNKTVEKICDSKNKTYSLFKEEGMPKQYFSLEELKDDVIYVAKPDDGMKGEGIQFLNKKEIYQIDNIFKTHVVQEKVEYNFLPLYSYLPSSIIKDLKSYDLRVIFVNRKATLFLIRYSRTNISNIAQGGESIAIEIKNLDPYNLKLCKSISNYLFDRLPKDFNEGIFSVDFCLNKNEKIKIFELNSKPGINAKYSFYINNLIVLLTNKFINASTRKKVSKMSKIFEEEIDDLISEDSNATDINIDTTFRWEEPPLSNRI